MHKKAKRPVAIRVRSSQVTPSHIYVAEHGEDNEGGSFIVASLTSRGAMNAAESHMRGRPNERWLIEVEAGANEPSADLKRWISGPFYVRVFKTPLVQ